MLWNFFPYICIFLTAKENMSTSCFIMLHFTVLWKFWAFYKIKVCGNPALSKAMSAIFPTAFAHFVFLLYLAILITFQIFHYYYICDGELWSVIFDATIAKKLWLVEGSDDNNIKQYLSILNCMYHLTSKYSWREYFHKQMLN